MMRAVFGVVALLVVLAIVGVLATRQLRATGQAVGSAVSGASAQVPAATVPEQSQQLQQRVQSDVSKALEAGAAARREEAEK